MAKRRSGKRYVSAEKSHRTARLDAGGFAFMADVRQLAEKAFSEVRNPSLSSDSRWAMQELTGLTILVALYRA